MQQSGSAGEAAALVLATQHFVANGGAASGRRRLEILGVVERKLAQQRLVDPLRDLACITSAHRVAAFE
jgi:hypothetical protein